MLSLLQVASIVDEWTRELCKDGARHLKGLVVEGKGVLLDLTVRDMPIDDA